MRIDLRYAGLTSDAERRLRLAASTMAAHHLLVSIAPWDGTKCSVLVADADDAYGYSSLTHAIRRGTPVVAFGGGTNKDHFPAQWVPRGAGIPVLLRAIEQAVPALAAKRAAHDGQDGYSEADSSRGSSGGGGGNDFGLVRMALDGESENPGDVLGSITGREFLLSRRTGRVRAASRSDLITLERKLAEPGWTFRPVRSVSEGSGFEIHASLDSICVNAAFVAGDNLPMFRDEPCWLDDWPDLGHASKHVAALRVARKLQQGTKSRSRITAELGVDGASVNACLWAFSASGLLRVASEPGFTERASSQSRMGHRVRGFLGRVAKHFGYTGDHGS